MRIREIETQLTSRITEQQARQLLQDKVEPIHSDLQEIKGQLHQIINRLLDGK